MGFSRREYWSGLPFPSPRDLPGPGIETTPLMSPALAGGFFTSSTTWETFNPSSTWACAVLSHSVVSDSRDPMDCSPPGSSVHGISQARVLEWIAVSFSRVSPGSAGSPTLQADSFNIWAARELDASLLICLGCGSD